MTKFLEKNIKKLHTWGWFVQCRVFFSINYLHT